MSFFKKVQAAASAAASAQPVELTAEEKQAFVSFTETFKDTGVVVPNLITILIRRSGTQGEFKVSLSTRAAVAVAGALSISNSVMFPRAGRPAFGQCRRKDRAAAGRGSEAL